MVGNGKQVVVDASVVVAWLLPDESLVEKVDAIFMEMVEGKLDFSAPGLLKYEVWNALRNAALRKRIDFTMANNLLTKFGNLKLSYYEADIKGEEVMKVCQKYGLTAYDASYVALAKKLKCELLSNDDQLEKLAKV